MKKVWPIALAATAIFFTTGAAFGLMSWGKVASTLVTKVGIKGTLGKILTGSIAGAGWGAAIGGGVSAATGGSFTEGARSGALSGAITGGLAGAAGWTPGVKPTSASNTADIPLEYHDYGGPPPVSDFPQNLVNTAAGQSRGATSTGGGSSLIGFLKNPAVAGNLISGVGKGIGTAAAARTQADMAAEERWPASWWAGPSAGSQLRLTSCCGLKIPLPLRFHPSAPRRLPTADVREPRRPPRQGPPGNP